MLSDSRGQLSIELVFLIALMFVLVMAITPFIGKNNELDKVMSTAKTGFIDASNDIAYSGTGNVIKFNNMTLNNGTITLTCSSKFKLDSGNITYIQNKMLANIASALNANVTNGSVNGLYNTYKVSIVNLS